MADVLDEFGYHLGDEEVLAEDEKAAKEKEKPVEGLDKDGNWIGVSEKVKETPAPAPEKPQSDKKKK